MVPVHPLVFVHGLVAFGGCAAIRRIVGHGHAHAIKIEAQAMLGTFLQSLPHQGARGKRGPGRGKKTGRHKGGRFLSHPDLKQVTRKESAESQLLAKIKEDAPQQFEAIRGREKDDHASEA